MTRTRGDGVAAAYPAARAADVGRHAGHDPLSAGRRLLLAGLLAVLVLVAAPSNASAQRERDPTELWEEFPLDPSPTPSATAAGERRERVQEVPRDDGPGTFSTISLIILAAGAGAMAVSLAGGLVRARAAAKPKAATAGAARLAAPIEPVTDEPPAVKPAAGTPAGAECAEAEPVAIKPAARKSAEAEPVAIKPAVRKAAEGEPIAIKRGAVEPAARKPAESKPSADEPAEAKPATIEPAARKPASARPSGILLTVGALAVATNVSQGEPVTLALTLGFLLICPGMALVGLLRIEDPWVELTAAVALSIALDAVVTGALVYAGAWSPTVAFYALGLVSIVGAERQLRRTVGGRSAT